MKYARITFDMLRMLVAIPLYLLAMLFSGIAFAFEYVADKVDVLDGPHPGISREPKDYP